MAAPRRPPAPSSRFFGRSAELNAVWALLGGSRLVTVVGVPGGGKTRVATELADRQRARFADSVVAVDLATVGEGRSVLAAVASAAGIGQSPGRSLEDSVTDALARSEALVLLDNCEHLADAVADLVTSLLACCPDVRVLATTRVPLGVHGEQLYPLPPLGRDASVALFADRASMVRPAFAIDDRNRTSVEEICHRLDGLPLAIELSAGWSRVLAPADILDRLGFVLPHPAGPVGADERHQTMEATIAWSYRRLAATQRALFDRLSVFVGGFDLPAAEAVAGVGPELLDGLAALVDHSLLLTEPSASTVRYRMLEPLRQYGAAALATRADDRLPATTRHAEHYRALARRCDDGLLRADRAGHLLELSREEGNLRAAMSWARDHDPETELRIAVSLAPFWEQCGVAGDARERLVRILDRGVGDSRLRAAALARLGRLAWRQADNDAARAHFTASHAISQRLGDQRGIARGLRNLALVDCADGDARAATERGERSLRLLDEHGDGSDRAWTWTVLGLARFVARDWPGGERCCRRAMEEYPEQRGGLLHATTHLGIAYAAANSGDTRTHREHLTAALAGVRDALEVLDDPDWLWAASGLAANEGRTRAALRLAGAARAVHGRGSRMTATLMTFSDAAVRRARHEVGQRAADGFMADGAAMTPDQLFSEALALPSGSDRPLSAREREVAELVGHGLTNEQIAARLVLSRRTVETHLERVKDKLALAGRHEVMAWAIGRRLEREQAR